MWGLLKNFNYVAVKIPNYFKGILNRQEAFFFFFSQFFSIKQSSDFRSFFLKLILFSFSVLVSRAHPE